MNPEFAAIDNTAVAQRGPHHRRALSDNLFRFSDDLLFDTDLSFLDLPSPTEGFPAAPLDSTKTTNSGGRPPMGHLRSHSGDASSDFFGGMTTFADGGGDNGVNSTAVDVPSSGGRRAGAHRRNNSMDGGSSSSFEADSFMDGVKKIMTPDKLAELALVDPKRARKILANRQSAARSKERKTQYTGELERKVQTLQTEATTLSTQVTMLQRDTTGLSSQNRELKLRLQALEQQAQLKDALNGTLKDEVQRLRIAASQILPANGNAFNRSSTPFGSQQTIPHPQLHMPQPSNNDQNSTKQHWPSFLDYNHRV